MTAEVSRNPAESHVCEVHVCWNCRICKRRNEDFEKGVITG